MRETTLLVMNYLAKLCHYLVFLLHIQRFFILICIAMYFKINYFLNNGGYF